MIAYLRGQIYSVGEDHLILDVSGVGYELSVTTETLVNVSPGQSVELFVYTAMREDSLQLFGFLSDNEKRMFLSLNKVNGIGPKMAMTILSGAPIARISSYIENSDVKGLTSLPKVGKKTAEQMILSLKGKLVISDRLAVIKTPVRTEISSALTNLGFKQTDVDRVVDELEQNIDVETGVRRALQALTKG